MKLISAISTNGIIGAHQDGKDIIPWHYKEDFQHFKKLTTGCPVIMGDITYFSIKNILGKPLPNRRNIVLSKSHIDEDVEQYHSIEELIKNVPSDSWVIGGRSIYEQLMKYCNELHLTIVPEVDVSKFNFVVKFPFIDPSMFVNDRVCYLSSDLKYVVMKRDV
jgi:dihydrofolate reductase